MPVSVKPTCQEASDYYKINALHYFLVNSDTLQLNEWNWPSKERHMLVGHWVVDVYMPNMLTHNKYEDYPSQVISHSEMKWL